MNHLVAARAIGYCAAVLLNAPSALATTWVVDDNGGPGVDFVNVQDAIDAAVDGDVIEVRAGSYPGFTIDGKALVVSADGATPFARVAAPVVVTNVDAARRVELAGLVFDGPGPTATCVALARNAGPVRLVDCLVQAMVFDVAASCGATALDGLNATACLDVTLVRTSVVGGGFYYDEQCGIDGGVGLVADASALVLIDSHVVGGRGGASATAGGDAGHAAVLGGSSSVLVHRSSFRRAIGGLGGCHPSCTGSACFQGFRCPDGAVGEGVVVLDGSSLSWKDSTASSVVPPDAAHEIAIAPLCVGTFEECPCANHGAGTAGCEHALGLGGARLEGAGNASVSADTVTLAVTGLAPGASPTALLLQGTASKGGAPFDDGLLCVGGATRNVGARFASGGTVRFGSGVPGGPISLAGGVPPAGGTRTYQVWYRSEAAAHCTPQRSNLSNAVEVAWAP